MQSFKPNFRSSRKQEINLEPRVSPALCQRLVAGTKSWRNSGLEIDKKLEGKKGRLNVLELVCERNPSEEFGGENFMFSE